MALPNLDSAQEPVFTTEGGYRRLCERVARARADYDAVTATNADAAEAGDNSVWHDNFAYEENQRRMHQLARRVHDLEAAARRAQIVPRPASYEVVALGCAVLLEDEDGLRERLVIGGWEDSDPERGRVSYTAPLARAFVSASVGEARMVRFGGKERELLVVAIEPAKEEEL